MVDHHSHVQSKNFPKDV
jgi:hypothetical protein